MADVLLRVAFGRGHSPGCAHGYTAEARVVCLACFETARLNNGARIEPGDDSGGTHGLEPRESLSPRDREHRRRMLDWLRQA